MKKIAYAIVPVLALAGGAAMALDTPTQTLSFGTQGSINSLTVGGTAVTAPLAFDLFGQKVVDLGLEKAGYTLILDSIHYTMTVQLDTDGSLTNNTSTAAAQGDYTITLVQNWATTYKDANYSDASKTWGTSGTSVVDIDTGGFNIAAGGGIWDPVQQTVGSLSDAYDATGLGLTSGDWFNTGTFNVTTAIWAITNLSATIQGGTATYTTTVSTATWGEVSLYYDYTYSANSVPVPAPLALIGLGLGFLGLRRRFAR